MCGSENAGHKGLVVGSVSNTHCLENFAAKEERESWVVWIEAQSARIRLGTYSLPEHCWAVQEKLMWLKKAGPGV